MPNRLRRFFTTLVERDPSGGSWLTKLLAATPHGRLRLGEELVEAPGWLVLSMAMRTASGRLGCFEQPAPPPAALLRWFIDHPDRLVWPPDAELTPEFTRLRRALVCDDPAGSRVRAQDRARELVATRIGLAPEWWRFEGMTTPDCVLITPRLVVTVVGAGAEPPPPATPWYPPRSAIVRGLEAARQIASERRFASVLVSEERLPEGRDSVVAQSLAAGAPHLSDDERAELHAGYLGNLTWEEAGAAVGVV